MTTPIATSVLRFATAFACSAAVSVCIPFLITPVLISATGRRELGMAIGVPVGMLLGWILFPPLAWRPFRVVHLLAIPVVAVVVIAGLQLLPEHWLTSRENDRNGVYGAMINALLCAFVCYGGLTLVRNKSITDHPRSALPRNPN